MFPGADPGFEIRSGAHGLDHYCIEISNTIYFKYDFFDNILYILSFPIQYFNKKKIVEF